MESPFLSPLSPYHDFFLQYGQFLAAWNSFEVLVEIAIMRELRLSVEESAILSGSLGFGAKSAILGALLRRTEAGQAKFAVIIRAKNLAERNGFAHGFISLNDESDRFTLVRREVRENLEVKSKVFSSLTMQKHAYEFYNMYSEAQRVFGITDDDLIRYQREVESFEKAPPIQATPRRGSRSSSGLTKRERSRLRRAQMRGSPPNEGKKT